MAKEAGTGVFDAAADGVSDVHDDPMRAFNEGVIADATAGLEPEEGTPAAEPPVAEPAGEEMVPDTKPEAEPEPDAAPAAEPEAEPAAEPAADKDAPAEPAPEPEPEGEAKEATFDPAAFADEFGVTDTRVFEKCENRDEALARLAKHAGHYIRMHGNQAREIGDLRDQVAELQAKAQALAAPDKPSAADVTQKPDDWTPEQTAAWLEKFEERPAEAIAEVLKAKAAGVSTGLTREEVEAMLADRDAQLAARQVVENEWATLTAPSDAGGFGVTESAWKERQPVMQLVEEDLGATPSLIDGWQLAELRETDIVGYEKVLDQMKRHVIADTDSGVTVATLAFKDARLLALGGKVAEPKRSSASLELEAQRKKASARSVGPPGSGGLPSAVPDVTAEHIGQLTRDEQVGWLGVDF